MSSDPVVLPSRELRDMLDRADQLPEAELLQLYERLVIVLDGQRVGEPRRDRRLRERADALRTLHAVRAQLGLAENERLPVKKFTTGCRALDNDWNAARVIRAWGTWRNATDVLAGATPPRRAEQEAVKLAHGLRRSGHRPPLDGLLEWLKTSPSASSMHAYDAWARGTNASLAPDQAPYLGGSGTANAMQMTFAVARRHAQAILDGAEPEPVQHPAIADHELLTLSAFARKLGLTATGLKGRAEKEGRPLPPVLRHDARVYWTVNDCERWISGETMTRAEHELNETVLDQRRLAQRLGLALDTTRRRYLHSPHLLPEPTGQIDGRPWWSLTEVEQWQATDQATGQRRRHHGPDTITIGEHHLLTLPAACQLLGIAHVRFRKLRDQGHLPAAMVFAGRPLWLEEDLHAYQDGRETQRTEGDLNGLLLGTADIARRLGVNSRSVHTGTTRGSDRYPRPNGALGTRPWWDPQRFEDWLAERQDPLMTAVEDQSPGRGQHPRGTRISRKTSVTGSQESARTGRSARSAVDKPA